MQDIDTALLRTFKVLAETSSFSRTANLIGRTQSTVTAQVLRLEDQLGVSLFTRTTRSVTLTPQGEAIRGVVGEILRMCEALQTGSSSGELSGEVRFGAPEDFVSQYLPDVLAQFSTNHPKVRLHVECDFTRLLLERYEAGGLDVLIVKQKPGAGKETSFRLWTETLAWVAKPDYVIPEQTPLPLVLSPAPCVYRARALSALDDAAIRWHDVFTSPSLAGMMAAVQAGFGVAVMPSTAISPALAKVDNLPQLEQADLNLIEGPHAGPAARALTRHLLTNLKQESGLR